MAQRHEFADYYNIGTEDEPEFMLMGVGFTTLDESPNAQTDGKIYIHEKSQTTRVKSYQTTFPFNADMIESEEIITDIYDIATRHGTGAKAEREYVRVELWRSADNQADVFTARKFNVSVQVGGISGAGGEAVALSGNLNALGDPVEGTFDITTKTFTKV